jgi:predicted HTH domain antitoxin
MPSSYNLSEIDKKKIDALVKAGYYSSKSDVVKDAIRTFLHSKKNLSIAAAIEMYKKGEITLGKAAEIANMSIVAFKEILKDYGIKRVIDSENASKMDREIERIKRRFG